MVNHKGAAHSARLALLPPSAALIIKEAKDFWGFDFIDHVQHSDQYKLFFESMGGIPRCEKVEDLGMISHMVLRLKKGTCSSVLCCYFLPS